MIVTPLSLEQKFRMIHNITVCGGVGRCLEKILDLSQNDLVMGVEKRSATNL